MRLGLYDRALHGVRYFLLRRLPPCKAMAPLMSESLERPLSLRERVSLKLHLWVCVWCVWYLEQLRLVRRTAAARAARQAADDDEISSALTLSAEARERLRRALRQSSS